MTELEMDKVRAEIQKLFDDAAKSRAESEKFKAEIAKVQAEAAKLMAEPKWYPVAIGAGLFGAIAAFVKLFL
ncbi:MAG: hypothetical protein LBP99_00705 [Azoarcus sp.]|nr:hypothetical protein [Azoarcus sp.]